MSTLQETAHFYMALIKKLFFLTDPLSVYQHEKFVPTYPVHAVVAAHRSNFLLIAENSKLANLLILLQTLIRSLSPSSTASNTD